MAKKVVGYLEDNNHNLCDDADDNRCELHLPQHAAAWALMGKIWDHIGLERTWEMMLYDVGDEYIVRLESQFAGIKEDLHFEDGYEIHLVGVELLIRQKIGYWTKDLQLAANTLRTRQPENPFYEYLTNGRTRKSAELVLEKCPVTKPENSHQWAWQRAEYEKAWENSMGWDCIAMINLLVGE
jgi:hypothetical protein